MADYVIERRLWLAGRRPEVFGFFADPKNLVTLHPEWARPTWLVEPPSRLDVGTVLDFSVAVAGFGVRWRVMVREFDPPFRFVDAQLWGPFARWEHRHRFLDEPPRGGGEASGTWVEDRVTYRLPLGLVGRVAHALGAGRRIAGLFDHRDRRLREIFG
jgi:ligand-binding SRPBCC domain-containing protein